MTAHLIDDLTEDNAHSSVVVQQHGFAGCLSKDIMERRSYESQHLSHCMNRQSAIPRFLANAGTSMNCSWSKHHKIDACSGGRL